LLLPILGTDHGRDRQTGVKPASATTRVAKLTFQTIPTPAFSQLFYEHTDSLRNPPTRLPKNDQLSATRKCRSTRHRLDALVEQTSHREWLALSVSHSTLQGVGNWATGRAEVSSENQIPLQSAGTCHHKNLFRPVNRTRWVFL